MRKLVWILVLGMMAGSVWGAAGDSTDKAAMRNPSLLLLPKRPQNRQPPPEIGLQIEKFFVGVSQDRVDEAFQGLLAGSEYLQKKYQINDFIQKTKQAISIYGKLNGYELYDNKKVGSRLMVLTYFVYLKSTPLRWRLIYYAADSKNWQIINLSVDDLLDESLLAE